MCEHITINGISISAKSLPEWKTATSGISADLAEFLHAWFSPAPTIELRTSGSTGKPKIIHAPKSAMRASAQLSCEIFGLTRGKTALLSLPLQYIAGKMMVVRALVSGCELLLQEPSSTPLAALTSTIDFAPLVPMQATTTLQHPQGREQLSRVRQILLGGSFIDSALTDALQTLPSQVYASYGMTETLSHIALRHINGPERSEWYKPLRGVTLALTPEHTLAISAPHLGISQLVTNDVAEIAPNGSFRILGRIDSVINSGGVKIQAEEVEQQLQACTGLTVLAVPAPHAVLGQCVALLWEGPVTAHDGLQEAILNLPAYHRPRYIRHLSALPRTATGKLNRAAAAALFSPNSPPLS